MYRESCQWGGGNKPVDHWDCRSPVFSFFFFYGWPGSQPESQWVLLRHSVSSSFKPPERASGVSKTAVLSLYALGGFGAADPGHNRERERENKWRSTGRAMKSKMRGGMDGKDEEAGVCVCVCSLQVDTPQVSGWGDGVALRAQLLVPLWRRDNS